MPIFSPSLCEKLRSHGLNASTSSEFINCFAFNGPVTFLGKSTFIRSKIDSFSYVNGNSTCITSSIGRYCSIATDVVIGMGIHDLSEVSTSQALCRTFVFDFAGCHVDRLSSVMQSRHGEETNNVTIGNDVWIGTHVLIPGDVTIGHGAVIGAGSIITKDIPPYAVVVGNNRIVRYRFSDEIISDLIETNWWNYNLPVMINNGAFRGGVRLDAPKSFIKFFKNADPASLIPLPVRWYYVDLKTDQAILDKISLVPVKESIKLYHSIK